MRDSSVPGSHVWNVSSGKQCTTLEILEHVKERHKYTFDVVEVAAGEYEKESLALCNNKLYRELGITPTDISKVVRRA